MNNDQVAGIIRAIVSAVGGYLAGKGYIDSETAVAVGGAVVVIATAVWSFISKKPATV